MTYSRRHIVLQVIYKVNECAAEQIELVIKHLHVAQCRGHVALALGCIDRQRLDFQLRQSCGLFVNEQQLIQHELGPFDA